MRFVLLLACSLLARPVLSESSASCTGMSKNLPEEECKAWTAIWDDYKLSEVRQRGCAGGRTDPCASPTCVYCEKDRVVAIDLGDRGLTGSVHSGFASFSKRSTSRCLR